MTKGGTTVFAAKYAHVLCQIDSKSKLDAFAKLPWHLPTISSVFWTWGNISEFAEDVAQGCDNRPRPTRTVMIERDVTYMERELIPGAKEACSLVVAKAFWQLGARCLWYTGVGRGHFIVGHGDAVVQGVNIGGVEFRRWDRGEAVEGKI